MLTELSRPQTHRPAGAGFVTDGPPPRTPAASLIASFDAYAPSDARRDRRSPDAPPPHEVRFVFDSVILAISGAAAAPAGDGAAPAPLEVVRCSVTRHGPMTRPTLHLTLRGGLPAVRAAEVAGDSDGAPISDPRLRKDPGLARLLSTLMALDDAEAELGATCAHAVGVAIVSRLTSLLADPAVRPHRRVKSALPKWRLKRVFAYVDAHLAHTVTLADLAGAAGLTRMHFAAQFRVATGVRPHEYLMRRRIERAQAMLAVPGASLVDVALSVGFQTQAHFTTVFKRFTGQTPHRWRSSEDWQPCACAPAVPCRAEGSCEMRSAP